MVKFYFYIATLGPIGYFYPASGTAASVIAVIPGAILAMIAPFYLVAAILVVIVIGIHAADLFQAVTGEKDAKQVVIDEVAGQWVALLVPAYLGLTQIVWPIAALVLFRAFDILKPWPIRKLEDLPGGLGVMADDIMAGLYATGCLYLIYLLTQQS